jgi:hypothetical protein
MSEVNLPLDATLLSIRDDLAEEYVRRIYASVNIAEKDLGNAQLRIAVNDGINAPSYRIDAAMDEEIGRTTHQEIISGRTHKPVLPAKAELLHWSSEMLALPQIRQLMGEIRGYKKPKV